MTRLIEVLVDGETHGVSVASLKRLAGQERSLTRKSQHVAQQRKQAEDALQKTDAVLQAMLQSEERYKPYASGFLVASKTMDDADFAALRKKHNQRRPPLRRGSRQFLWRNPKAQQAAQKGAAREAVKVLQENILSGRTRCITTPRARHCARSTRGPGQYHRRP